MKKIAGYFMTVALILAVPSVLQASQTGQKLKEAGQKIDELQKQKKEAEEKVGNLKEQESGLQGNLADLNTKLSDVSVQINDLEGQITDKQGEIDVTSEQLKQAKKQKKQQYESMKLRIRFIYEHGGTDMYSVLFASTSMADLLNRAEYIEEINQYDRMMLDRYQSTCEQVAAEKKNLKEEKEQLVTMEADMQQKKTQVDQLITQTENSIESKQAEISQASSDVDAYEAQIAKMKAYEEELEKQKAKEAKRLAEQQKKKEKAAASSGGGGTVTAGGSDQAMLAALVECEAGGESYEGQLAVASVVVNRVKSGSFPNTISGVIYQGGQFSPVASGRFAMVLARGASGSCAQAAQAALSGGTNVGSLYFCRADSGVSGNVIGNHVFY